MNKMLMTNDDAMAISGIVQAIANMQNEPIQQALIEVLIDEMRIGKRIALIGTGKTFSLLNRAESTARSLGLDCTAFCSNTLAHGDFGGLLPTDLQIFISKSGTTQEIVQAAIYAKSVLGLNEDNMIALTCQPLYVGLNVICGCSLILPIQQELQATGGCDIAPTLSSIAFNLVLDLLMTKASNLDNSKFKRLHPGGTIGKLS